MTTEDKYAPLTMQDENAALSIARVPGLGSMAGPNFSYTSPDYLSIHLWRGSGRFQRSFSLGEARMLREMLNAMDLED